MEDKYHYIGPGDIDLLRIVDSVDEAMSVLANVTQEPQQNVMPGSGGLAES
jgi:hypothetical protein